MKSRNIIFVLIMQFSLHPSSVEASSSALCYGIESSVKYKLLNEGVMELRNQDTVRNLGTKNCTSE
jgi:hypothetical protein